MPRAVPTLYRSLRAVVAADAALAAAVAAEIAREWRGARVDRISQPGPHALCLQLRKPGATGYLLLAATPPLARVHLIARRPASTGPLATFGQLARRHLEGSRLLGARTPGLERVIECEIEGRDELGNPRRLTLVAEVTGQLANLLLLGPDGRILDAVRRFPGDAEGARTLLPGAPYVPPPRPADRLDPVALLAAEGWPALRAALAAAMGTGGPEPESRVRRAVFGLTPLLVEALAGWAGGAPGAPPPPEPESDPLIGAVGGLAWSVCEGRFRPALARDARGRPLPLAWPLPQVECRPAPGANAACAEAYGERAAGERMARRREQLGAVLRGAVRHVERRLAKQEVEMAGAEDAEQLRREGELLLCFLHLVPRGAGSVTLPALEDPDTSVTLALDPAASPVQNAERRLRAYRKAKRAQEAVAARLAAGRAELAYLREAEIALAHAEDAAALEALAAELGREGVVRPERARRAGGTRETGPLPPLVFDGGAGWRILVGRNASGNDRLTMAGAHPQDIWLHARQLPGSHVLLKAPPGPADTAPPDAALLAAARCAAYYSAGRQGSHIPVDWTRRGQVWKPAGARPGFVLYGGERTLLVDPVDLPPELPAP